MKKKPNNNNNKSNQQYKAKYVCVSWTNCIWCCRMDSVLYLVVGRKAEGTRTISSTNKNERKLYVCLNFVLVRIRGGLYTRARNCTTNVTEHWRILLNNNRVIFVFSGPIRQNQYASERSAICLCCLDVWCVVRMYYIDRQS